MLIPLFYALLGFAVLRFAQLPLSTICKKYSIVCDLSLLALLLVFANFVDGILFLLLLVRELCSFINSNILHSICGNFSLISSMFFINTNVLLECSEFELDASHTVMCKLLVEGLRHQEVNGN